MLPTVRKLGGKSTNLKKCPKPSGDVPVESPTKVVEYGVFEERYELEGNVRLPPIFRPNLQHIQEW